jgi:hypothetical protein
MKKAWPEKSTLFYYSICCLHLSRTGKMISGIQFYENGMSNIMQNGGNDAKINRIPPQYYPIGMKMLANFTRRGIWEIMIFPPQKQSTCANHNNGPAAVCSYGL